MIDMQTYLSLGTVVIFSIIVPGVLLTATTLVVRHNALNISSYELFASVVIYGFLANIFGHFLGLLHRRLQKKYKEIPFQVIYTQSYDLPKEKAVLLRKDGEYWFGIYTLYWNVAWGLPFIVLFYFKYLSLLHLAILLVSFILLLTLSISILDNLIQLQPTTAAMIKRSMYRISLVDNHISLLRASDIDAVAK